MKKPKEEWSNYSAEGISEALYNIIVMQGFLRNGPIKKGDVPMNPQTTAGVLAVMPHLYSYKPFLRV